MQLSSVEDIIEDYRQGRMVIITDDEHRENEGDLMVAAPTVTPDIINFMARYGRGLICITLTHERCRQLGLELMTTNNGARYSTRFTVSIEAAEGVTTGISAADRATTVLAAVAPDATANDIVSPGHVFPIMAQPGGVLARAGHTEAGTDLARMAGFEPASVICEILKEDGSMARMPDLVEFAAEHELKICSIAELIRYRLAREPTVIRTHETEIESEAGQFKVLVYHDADSEQTHVALIKGSIDPDTPVPVRVQVESDLVGVLQEITGAPAWNASSAVKYISEHDCGVLIVLRYRRTEDDVLKVINYAQHTERRESGGAEHQRLLGAGSQILADIGLRKIRVMGGPKKLHGLAGFGLEIVDHIVSPDD